MLYIASRGQAYSPWFESSRMVYVSSATDNTYTWNGRSFTQAELNDRDIAEALRVFDVEYYSTWGSDRNFEPSEELDAYLKTFKIKDGDEFAGN